jgi:hypothetical protein
MKILWAEDDFDKHWLEDSEKKFDYNLIKDFTKAYYEINKNIDDYDFVILDMNLEGSNDGTKLIQDICKEFKLEDTKKLLNEGGYYLFIQLIINNFPKDRIVCFTGNYGPNDGLDSLLDTLKTSSNAVEQEDILKKINKQSKGKITEKISEHEGEHKNKPSPEEVITIIQDYFKTLGNPTTSYQSENESIDFRKRFLDARIQCPKIIAKGDHNALPEHLERFSEDPYILLRRAIINACNYLIESLKNKECKIEINKALDENHFNNDQSLFLLQKLKIFLPICQPHDENDHILSDLLRFVNHDWDKIDWDDIKKNQQSINAVFMKIVKSVRNSSAHGNIFNSAGCDLVAFILLINMRVLFSLPDKTLPYEKEFLKIISIPTEEDLSDHKSLAYKLSGRYLRIRNTFTKPWALKIDDIYQVDYGEKLNDKQKKYLLDSFYDYFWYLTSTPKTTPLIKDQRNKLSLTIEFKEYNYTTSPYLLDFSKHLYTQTFNKD